MERSSSMTESLETKILAQHGAGKKNREIARELGIHHNTVSYWLKQNGLKANYFGQPIDLVSETQARCRKCNQIKLLSEYQFGRKGKQYEYRFSYCNDCRKRQVYLNLNSDINKFLADRFNRTKRRAKKLNIPFNISKKEFINQFNSQNGLCFYTDVKMVCEVGSDLHRDSMSIDKIIPDKGYVLGNVVFATNKINCCKNDLSLEEIQKWMPEWYKRIEKFLGKDLFIEDLSADFSDYNDYHDNY